MIECSNFTVIREHGPVFKPLTFTVTAGQCLRLLGDNGAGKTTCLRALAKLKNFHGTLVIEQSSYLAHSNGLYLNFKVSSMLNFWHDVYETKTKITTDLPLNAIISNLSAGQKRKLAWLRLLIEQNSVWLLDEPLTNLDQAAKIQIIHQIKNHLQNNGAIILATHMPEDFITHEQTLESLC